MISNKDKTSINTMNANVVKRCFIEAMLKEGLINEETYAEMEKYAVVCTTPDVLGEYISSIHESKEDQFFVVKMVDLPEKTDIENNAFLTSQEELIQKIEALEEENVYLKSEIGRLAYGTKEVK